MAKNFMSNILDELMGRNRDALPTEQPKKLEIDDPDICPFYMVCFCPHELFVNTKADLGTCPRVHDEQLRHKYLDEASVRLRSSYESEFIRFAEKMISDIEAKIKRGKMRIALANGPDGGTYAGPGSKNAERISLLTERINSLIDEAEKAGCDGDVEKAQGIMKLCEQLKEEREQLKSHEITHPVSQWNPDKAMQVCEVCGSYLIIGEAQHRLDDHIMGKQHVGFAMLRKNLEEVKKLRETRDKEEREKSDKEREKRNRDRDTRDRDQIHQRDWERKKVDNLMYVERERGERMDRPDRGRDRIKDEFDKERRRSRSRDKKDRTGDLSRERRYSEHDKERKKSSRKSRSRSKSREKDRKRKRSKSRERKKEKSHKKSKDKDKERDRDKSKRKHSTSLSGSKSPNDNNNKEENHGHDPFSDDKYAEI